MNLEVSFYVVLKVSGTPAKSVCVFLTYIDGYLVHVFQAVGGIYLFCPDPSPDHVYVNN